MRLSDPKPREDNLVTKSVVLFAATAALAALGWVVYDGTHYLLVTEAGVQDPAAKGVAAIVAGLVAFTSIPVGSRILKY